MGLHDLRPAEGSKKMRKILGRGHGTGQGKTSGKGHKGQKARSGSGVRPGFEGGQMPLQRRIPKRGFNNIFAKKVVAVNVERLGVFENGSIVTKKELIESRIVKCRFDKIKILGNGDINKNLTVRVNSFSKSAIEKIAKAGGKAEVV